MTLRAVVVPAVLVGLGLAGLGPGSATAAAAAPAPVATLAKTPWEIAPLPSGGSFVVQRDGDVGYSDATDRPVSTALSRSAIPSVRKLLGLALAPDFSSSHLAYLYVSQSTDPDQSGPATGTNGIWRLRANGTQLEVERQVFGGIDSDGNHDGGRMVFGPDGNLYVTTGDIHQPGRPQDLTSLNGKILRLQVGPSGGATAPPGNPFVGQGGKAAWVWSYGHRHPQGLAFDAAGRLWETEHGPTGEQHGTQYPGGNNKTGRDELNLIVPGGNYGWPLVSGPMTGPGLIPPKAVAGDSPSWAPGDLTVGSDGALYAPFLAGQELRRFAVSGDQVVGQSTVLSGVGRLRVAVTRGSQLLVAGDGDSPPLYRLDLATLTSTPASAPPDAVAIRTEQVADTVVAALRDRGRRGLLRRHRIVVTAPGPDAGRLRIAVRLARHGVLGHRRFALAGSDARRFRVPLTAAGRLRGVKRPAVVVRVVLRAASGRSVVVERRAAL